MSRVRALLRREDSGFTLVELIVAIGIFTILVVVFLGGVVAMSRTTVRAQEVTDAGDSVRRAFQTMDKQIRYASAINYPGVGASGAHYVEFLTESRPNGQPPLCTQWRYDPTLREVQMRTWPDVPSAPKSGWKAIAWEVRNDLAGAPPDQPFRLVTAGTTYTRQQLVLSLDVGQGAAGTDARPGADIGTVFVARNSSYLSPSNQDLDGDAVSDTPVCLSNLERP